jgi:glutaredoxin-related protein
MGRKILEGTQVAPSAAKSMDSFHTSVVNQIAEAVKKDRVVIVGMAQNPFVGKARKLLDEAGTSYTYLEYGSYFSKWKERLAIKMWSGWPTFPQVFINSQLIGGFQEASELVKKGELSPAK